MSKDPGSTYIPNLINTSTILNVLMIQISLQHIFIAPSSEPGKIYIRVVKGDGCVVMGGVCVCVW